MEAHGSMNPYGRPAITSLSLACGLADTPFAFTSYSVHTSLLILKS